MKFYEVVFITLPNISIQEVYRITRQYKDLISMMHGEILKKEYWGIKKLSYRIKNYTKGHYVFFEFKSTVNAINFICRELRTDQFIIKFLIINNKQLLI